MLETIREYALERLEQSGEAPLLRQQHAAYYLRLAEQAEPELRGPTAQAWLNRLEAEHPNLRAALGWALAEGAADLAARLATALAVFWDVHDHQREGQAWLSAILAAGGSLTPKLRARVLHIAGWLAREQNDRATAITRLEQSLALIRSLATRAACPKPSPTWAGCSCGSAVMRHVRRRCCRRGWHAIASLATNEASPGRCMGWRGWSCISVGIWRWRARCMPRAWPYSGWWGTRAISPGRSLAWGRSPPPRACMPRPAGSTKSDWRSSGR